MKYGILHVSGVMDSVCMQPMCKKEVRSSGGTFQFRVLGF